jgi:transposase-like protein
MIQRGGEVVLRMLPNVQHATLCPIIRKTIAPGSLIYTDE